MSKDAFHVIASGLSFDQQRNGKEISIFREGKVAAVAGQGSASSFGLGVASAVSLSDVTVSTMPASLNFFGVEEETAEGEAAASPADAKVEDSGDKPLKPMSRKRVVNIWKKHKLQVDGKDVPQPIEHFSDLVRPPLNCPRNIVNNLFQRDHKTPTAAQCQAVPAMLHGRDVMVCAPTGSGKTLAYLIPLFARLKNPNPEAGVRGIVVAPTMELAAQIEREAFLLMRGARWKLVQHGQTTKNKDIMVTTPQRLVSMIKDKHVAVDKVEVLVFDEGDKLWDSGTDFVKLIDEIVSACTNPDKVVGLFTATLSKKVEGMARSVMPNDPIRIIVNDRTAANSDVDQRLLFTTNEHGKILALRNLIREGFTPPALIFVQSIDRTKELYDEVNCAGLHCAIINSKMTTEERDEVVLNYRLGKIWVLITTELLARGIDFKNVGTVINYDFPATTESYIHRIGRTGRAGKKGTAITFFTEDDKERLPMVVKVMKDAGSYVEGWMEAIKTSKSKLKHLRKETPHRMIISTKKRQFLTEKAMQRELKALKRERDEKGSDDDISEGDLSE